MKAIKHPFKLLYPISFLFSVQYALVVYINSSYLEQFLSEKMIGILFALASFLTILVLLQMPKILSRFGNYRTSIFFVVLNILVFFGMATGLSSIAVILAFLLYMITNYALVLSRDIYIEEYTEKGKIGSTRGTLLTIINLALVMSPTAAVFLLSQASFFGVYIVAALATASSLFFIIPHLKNFIDPEYQRIAIRATFKKISLDSNLKRIYSSEFMLHFFYSWMVIYLPIYLHEYMHIPWQSIGTILTVMLLPFVLLDYPLGKLSDKIGEKKMLLIGYAFVSLATILIFFLNTQSILIWGVVLFLTRIGAATIEVMDESYFFKKINPEDAGLISFFRNMSPFAFIVGPILAVIFLFIAPDFKYLFLALGALMMLGILAIYNIRDEILGE